MVCSKSGLASTVAAVFMAGRIIGCLFAGQLADRLHFGYLWLKMRPIFVASSTIEKNLQDFIKFFEH